MTSSSTRSIQIPSSSHGSFLSRRCAPSVPAHTRARVRDAGLRDTADPCDVPQNASRNSPFFAPGPGLSRLNLDSSQSNQPVQSNQPAQPDRSRETSRFRAPQVSSKKFSLRRFSGKTRIGPSAPKQKQVGFHIRQKPEAAKSSDQKEDASPRGSCSEGLPVTSTITSTSPLTSPQLKAFVESSQTHEITSSANPPRRAVLRSSKSCSDFRHLPSFQRWSSNRWSSASLSESGSDGQGGQDTSDPVLGVVDGPPNKERIQRTQSALFPRAYGPLISPSSTSPTGFVRNPLSLSVLVPPKCSTVVSSTGEITPSDDESLSPKRVKVELSALRRAVSFSPSFRSSSSSSRCSAKSVSPLKCSIGACLRKKSPKSGSQLCVFHEESMLSCDEYSDLTLLHRRNSTDNAKLPERERNRHLHFDRGPRERNTSRAESDSFGSPSLPDFVLDDGVFDSVAQLSPSPRSADENVDTSDFLPYVAPCIAPTIMENVKRKYQVWSKAIDSGFGRSTTVVTWTFVHQQARFVLKLEHCRKKGAQRNVTISINGKLAQIYTHPSWPSPKSETVPVLLQDATRSFFVDVTVSGSGHLRPRNENVFGFSYFLKIDGMSFTKARLLWTRKEMRKDIGELKVRHAPSECEEFWTGFDNSSLWSRGDSMITSRASIHSAPICKSEVTWQFMLTQAGPVHKIELQQSYLIGKHPISMLLKADDVEVSSDASVFEHHFQVTENPPAGKLPCKADPPLVSDQSAPPAPAAPSAPSASAPSASSEDFSSESKGNAIDAHTHTRNAELASQPVGGASVPSAVPGDPTRPPPTGLPPTCSPPTHSQPSCSPPTCLPGYLQPSSHNSDDSLSENWVDLGEKPQTIDCCVLIERQSDGHLRCFLLVDEIEFDVFSKGADLTLLREVHDHLNAHKQLKLQQNRLRQCSVGSGGATSLPGVHQDLNEPFRGAPPRLASAGQLEASGGTKKGGLGSALARVARVAQDEKAADPSALRRSDTILSCLNKAAYSKNLPTAP